MRRLAWTLLAVGGCGRFGFDGNAGNRVDASSTPVDGAMAADAAPVVADASAPANRAFLTSTTHTGMLGGLAGADETCQDRADAAGLGGVWIARLRSAAVPLATRLAGARGWRDLTGLPIVDDAADWEGGVFHPLRRDEFGALVDPNRHVWTGGDFDSMPVADCQGWTIQTNGDFGGAAPSAESLAAGLNFNCMLGGSLACVEIAYATPVGFDVPPARRSFVTASSWNPSLGRANADARCATDAANAGLDGTYLAFLSAPGEGPGARFNASGLPWRAVGGPLLTSDPAALVGANPAVFLETYPGRLATGAIAGWWFAFVGSATEHCQNWSSNAFADRAPVMRVQSTDRTESLGSGTVCNQSLRIWCLEE